MARRNRRRNNSRKKGKSIKQMATYFLGLAAFLGPEAAAVLQGGFTPEAIAQAVSYKTGFNFLDGSWDPSRYLIGWGPSAGFAAGQKINGVVQGILQSMRVK